MRSKFERHVVEELGAIRETMAENTAVLREHERRSTNIEARMIPIESHVQRWAGAGKLLAVLGTLGGLAAAIARVLG